MGNYKLDADTRYAGYFAEWLVNYIAATVTGSKPSTILTLMDTRIQPLLTMWRNTGRLVLAETVIRYKVLHKSEGKETILFYRADMLEQCIQNPLHKSFLQELGYPVRSGLDACLTVLEQRFQNCCPHEIGILLGIPLQDVLGFMGLTKLPLTCRKEWCIYGNPDTSLAVMKRYDDDRLHIGSLIDRGFTARQILCGIQREVQYAV